MNELVPNLSSEEAWIFYKVLYRKEAKHTGYDWNRVSNSLKKAIDIDHSFKRGIVPETNKDNSLNFKCHSVAGDFLKHIRHAFAHGGISSDGNFYAITSYDTSKQRSMSGRIEKKLFEKLINEVTSSYKSKRDKPSYKRKKNSKATK